MNTIEESQIINLQDSYTLLYLFLARQLKEDHGEPGEAALREGIRRYGRDRGLAMRNKHLKKGVKINMYSLFAIGSDLPPDPRFKRERQAFNEQEYISHCLACPIADLWKQFQANELGRIYCEEFHVACYSTYAYGYAKVDMTHTITQDGDEICIGKNTLRPENLPDDLKPLCFEEYDPFYIPPQIDLPPADAKKGFNTLCVKLYYYLLEVAGEYLGKAGIQSIEKGLVEAAGQAVLQLQKSSADLGLPLDEAFIAANYPLYLDTDRDPLWQIYADHNAKEILQKSFIQSFIESCSGSICV